MPKHTHAYSDLGKKISHYLKDESIALVKKAYEFAAIAHHDQKRLSGEPYITHPLEVAIILAEYQQDAQTIAAALLHDTLEDCNVTSETLREDFGQTVLDLVDGVTKLGRINFVSEEAHLAENFRKMFLAMANDTRVILIRLADRLHNMRTLKYLPQDRRIRISQETREIFSPLAHRLGMGNLKWELEDLTFFYLEPEEFQKIKNTVASHRNSREKYIHDFIESITELVKEVNKNANIKGRPKHFYSIYKKMVKQKCTYDDLYDIFVF